MLSKNLAIAAIVSSVLVGACAHKPERSKEASQSFVPSIQKDGSKRFLFIVNSGQSEKGGKGQGERGGKGERSDRGERTSRGQGGSGERGNKGGGERGGRGGQSTMSEEDIRASVTPLLKAKLAETKYCRNSYIELDFSSVQGTTEIRGECQESASSADRKKWEN